MFVQCILYRVLLLLFTGKSNKQLNNTIKIKEYRKNSLQLQILHERGKNKVWNKVQSRKCTFYLFIVTI